MHMCVFDYVGMTIYFSEDEYTVTNSDENVTVVLYLNRSLSNGQAVTLTLQTFNTSE